MGKKRKRPVLGWRPSISIKLAEPGLWGRQSNVLSMAQPFLWTMEVASDGTYASILTITTFVCI